MNDRFKQIFDLDFWKITGAGATGFGTISFAQIESVLKVAIAAVTLAYMIWKWIKEAKKK